VCADLGLGELLARMPAGIEQIVGESGWQLSEGERSRVFLGRALLSGAGLVVLDECFAALDPDSLDRAWTALRRRVSTVVMVAHRITSGSATPCQCQLALTSPSTRGCGSVARGYRDRSAC
jgi:ABC-type multidrug transport system fused ATPase/permease subunit